MVHRRYISYPGGILLLLLFTLGTFAQNVKVKIETPEEVWVGDRFRVVYVIENSSDEEGEFKVGDFKGLKVASEPKQSANASIVVVGGERQMLYTQNISYVVEAEKAGKYTLPRGEFLFRGKKYKSEIASVRVKSVEQIKNDKVSFIRTIVSRTRINPDDTLMVTYRLYTTMDFRQILKAGYPSVNRDFYANNVSRSRQAIQTEEYDGKTYNVIDIRQLILQPRNIGQKTIPSGSVTVEFGIPTGKKIQDFWGDTYQEIIKEVQTLPIEEIKISVQRLIEV